MARETKVGLLAGLAFIICFAVILANRGREDSLAGRELLRHSLPVSERAADGGLITPSPAANRGASLPYPAVSELVNPRGPESGPSTGANVPVQEPSPRMATARRDPGTSPPIGLPARTDAPNSQTSSVGLPLSSPSAASRQVMEQTLDDLASKVGGRPQILSFGAAPQVGPPSSAPAPGDSATAKKTYTVLAGDTLSKIALAHYGSKSTNLVNNLFEANRTLLPNPDELKAGVELAIPEVQSPTGAEALAARKPESKLESKPKSSDKTAESRKKPAEKEKESSLASRAEEARWYQVKRGDQYFSIARDQLGDGSRWDEIFKLNKDRFADPEMIREGVRIKLPAPASPASQARKQPR